MAYTEADLLAKIASLEAMLGGVRSTDFADRSITYATPTEIKEQIDYFMALLTSLRGTVVRSKQAFGVSAKGF